VSVDDRRAAEAFNRGGIEEERAEKRKIKEEEKANHERNMNAFSRMIEEVRARKKEQDAMRAEDKYTEETDPVDTREKQMNRQVEKWKEDNKEELRDDMAEHAAKVLKAEKEEREKARAEKAEDTSATELETARATEDEEGASKQQKVDNRKLVYEDIWDEPAGETAAAPKFAPPPRTSAAPVSQRPSQIPELLQSAASTAAPFMPWASDTGSMESIAPSQDTIEKRKEQVRAARQGAAEASATDDKSKGPNSWYAKYAEKVAKTTAKLQSQPAPAPLVTPAAPAGSLAAVAGNFQEREQARTADSEPEDRAALGKECTAVPKATEPAAASPPAQTELDEMD